MTELLGKQLGKYRIVAPLGQGGMAQVYKAYHPGLDRYVAIKVMHQHLTQQGDFISRFEREAAAVARLRHANIMQVYDFDLEQDQYYMVMEFIEGPTLKQELKTRSRKNQPFALSQIIHIFNALGNALDHAHAQRMIHRDLKPDNVMITLGGEVVLTDFGIVHMLDDNAYKTQIGSIIGTPTYMSPEQGRGLPADIRSDIYALGVILYEIVTGQVPFRATTPIAIISHHVTTPLPPPTSHNPNLPNAVEQVITTALNKNPDERYQRASALAVALQQAVSKISDHQPLVPVSIPILSELPDIEEMTIASDEIGLTTPSFAGPLPPSPYRGLFAFSEEDTPLFFGRELFTQQLVDAVDQQSLIAVLGPSGSGKSSVVFAGLVPELQKKGNWLVIKMRPGQHPFESWAAALSPHLQSAGNDEAESVEIRQLAQDLQQGSQNFTALFAQVAANQPAGQRVLLVFDQFEELYTLCPDADIRQQFISQLLSIVVQQRLDPQSSISTAGSPAITTVLTLRADFLGQALNHRALADALQEADIKLGPMSVDELDRAIENPAARRGVTFEKGLAARILDDIRDEPGTLPLLQFALTQLWIRQTRRELTHESYEAVGRVEGALAHYAEDIYLGLNQTEQEQARRIFVQLVQPGERVEDTRRLAQRHELDPSAWPVVQKLADARLVVTNRTVENQDSVEVVHEVLLRGWSRLQGWLNQDRTFRAWQERLRFALRQWQNNQDQGGLLRGVALSEAEGWLERRADNISQLEQTFIQQSLELRTLEIHEREKQRRRIILALGTIGILAITFLAFGYWSAQYNADQERRAAATAEALRDDALRQSQISLAKSLAALAPSNSNDDELAALMAVEAFRLNQQADGDVAWLIDDTLRQHLLTPYFSNILPTEAVGPTTVAFAPDGKILAVGNSDGSIQLWSLYEPGVEPGLLPGDDVAIHSIAYSPTGNHLISGDALGVVRLWVVGGAQGELVTQWDWDFGVSMQTVAFSPDGHMIAAGGLDGVIRLWTIDDTENEAQILAGHADVVNSVTFSPDGKLLASGSDDGTIRLWSVEQPDKPSTLLAETEAGVSTVAFSPRGEILAAGGADMIIRLWYMDNLGAEPDKLAGHLSWLTGLVFSPDGQTLASSSLDLTVRLWDIANLTDEPQVLEGHTNSLYSIAYHHEGLWLASGSVESVRLWEMTPPVAQAQDLTGPVETVRMVAVGPMLNESTASYNLAGASLAGQTWLWTIDETETISQSLPGDEAGMWSVAFNPAGDTLATGGMGGTVQLWSLPQPETPTTVLPNHGDWVLDLDFSPDGQTLAAGVRDGQFGCGQWSIRKLNHTYLRHLRIAFKPLHLLPMGKL